MPDLITLNLLRCPAPPESECVRNHGNDAEASIHESDSSHGGQRVSELTKKVNVVASMFVGYTGGSPVPLTKIPLGCSRD